MSRADLLQKITHAKDEINVAEAELEDALRVMQTSSGGKKVTIGQVLEEAFAKLKSAKTSLIKLEAMLVNEE
jgi:hypothetical protein